LTSFGKSIPNRTILKLDNDSSLTVSLDFDAIVPHYEPNSLDKVDL